MLDRYNRLKQAINQIMQMLPSLNTIEQKSISLLKILLVFLTIYFLVYVAFWIFDKEEGIAVRPFEIAGAREDLDGKTLAALLRFDLQRIKEIYEPGQEISAIQKSSSRTIIRRPLGDFSLPHLALENDPLEYSISTIGTIGLEGTSFSVGSIFLSMNELFGDRLSTVTCNLQRCNSTVVIVAILEDHNSPKGGIAAFEVEKTLDKANISGDEQIPYLINDLAFKIALELRKREAQHKEDYPYPQTWQAFKYVTQGWDDYNSYIITRGNNSLDRARDMALLAKSSEPGYPGTFDLLSNLGFAYLDGRNFDEAEKIFRNITDFKPFESALGLGLIYGSRNNFEKALNEFDEAIRVNPKDDLAWKNKGVILDKLHRYDDAIQAFDNAAKLKPNDATTLFNKGVVLYEMGRYNESVQAYDKAIRLDPKNANAWYNKGLVLFRLVRFNESVRAYDKALELSPKLALAWKGKGIALESLGRIKEANAAFAKVRELGYAG